MKIFLRYPYPKSFPLGKGLAIALLKTLYVNNNVVFACADGKV